MARSPKRIHDEFLVLSCQAGDESAFELLYTRWQKPLLAQAWRLSRDHEAALEIVQETWLGILRGINRLDDPSRFPAWAFRIVANKTADWLRRVQYRRRLGHAPDKDRESVNPELVSDDCAGTAAAASLPLALRKLPADRRAMLSLFYIEEMSVREIALALDIPIGTVKSRLFNARKQLREVIERSEA